MSKKKDNNAKPNQIATTIYKGWKFFGVAKLRKKQAG